MPKTDSILELQERVSHLEHLLSELDDTVTQLHTEHRLVLERERHLIERIRDLRDQLDAQSSVPHADPLDERPPHY